MQAVQLINSTLLINTRHTIDREPNQPINHATRMI